MRIAVIEHTASGDYAEYIFSLIDELARQNNYQLKTWINSVPASQQRMADNVFIYVSFDSGSSLVLKWWYKIKIKSVLKKTKADIVIDLNGIASPNIKIPQLIIAGDFVFSNDANRLNSIQKFALNNLAKSANAAKNILAFSQQKADELFGGNEKKLRQFPFAAPAAFKTFEWHDKLMPKAQYADNKDYFVAITEDNNVNDFTLLLQAFSKFKKWQQSNMQLLILAKNEFFSSEITARHKTYKYRDDVRLLEEIEERQVAAIIASAHSMVHVFEKQPHVLIIAIALQCSLPVISFNNEIVKEYAGNAALYCKEKNAASLGDAMIQLYKDENMHAQLKEETQKQLLLLNRKESENKFWELLETAARS